VRSEPFVATRFIDITTPEATALIIKNFVVIKEALQMLNKLMHIARNLLVTTNPEIPQNLSATINFDHEVIEAICLCVNVLSKGIDGEMPEDEASRNKLNDLIDNCMCSMTNSPSSKIDFIQTRKFL
jgi:palmitoyltransferase